MERAIILEVLEALRFALSFDLEQKTKVEALREYRIWKSMLAAEKIEQSIRPAAAGAGGSDRAGCSKCSLAREEK